MAFTAQEEVELKALAARGTRRMRDLPEQTEYKRGLFVRVSDEDNPDPAQRDRKLLIELIGCSRFGSTSLPGSTSGLNDFPRSSGNRIQQIKAAALIEILGDENIQCSFVGKAIAASSQSVRIEFVSIGIGTAPAITKSQTNFMAHNVGQQTITNIIDVPGSGVYVVFLAMSGSSDADVVTASDFTFSLSAV